MHSDLGRALLLAAHDLGAGLDLAFVEQKELMAGGHGEGKRGLAELEVEQVLAAGVADREG